MFNSINFNFLALFTVPPKIDPLKTVSEALNADDFFQLVCTVVQGDFPFRITWLFNDETLYDSGHVQIERSKRSSMLSIDMVQGNDAGNYTCVASNEAGFTTASYALVVKGWSILTHFNVT